MRIKRRYTWRTFIPFLALFIGILLVTLYIVSTIAYTYRDFSFTPDGDYIAAVYLEPGQESIKPAVIAREKALEEARKAAETAAAAAGVAERSYSGGTIYLTFDDGPGAYTARLLDILAKYNVKATFFVTNAGDDSMILREYNEGHAVGLHTASHNYSYIYASIDNFFDDLYAVQDRVERITGYKSYLMRFPGGSSNTVSARYDGGTRIMSALVNEVEGRGFTYFDWNITSGDAGGTTTADGVYRNVVNNLKDGGNSVVLQHDIKGFSVDAVERIIQFGLANGFTFRKLDENSFTAHHGVNN